MPKKRKKPKQAHKRSPSERTADLLWLEREYLRGTRNPERLAQMLATERSYRIGEAQIRYDLADLRNQWREATKATYTEHLESVLAQLEEQERELWRSWSLTKETRQWSQSLGAIEVIGGPGDPAFQRLILDIQIRRCKLLGLDRPQKVEVDHSGAIAATIDVDSLDLDLETRKKLLAAVRKSNGAGRA